MIPMVIVYMMMIDDDCNYDDGGNYDHDDYEEGKPLPVLPVAACLPLAQADLGL